MNVKLEAGSIRFRITAEELESLKQGKEIRETLFIGSRMLAIGIDPVATGETFQAKFDDAGIRLLVSPEKIAALMALGRSREGIEQASDEITVSLQVDFRTQKRQSA